MKSKAPAHARALIAAAFVGSASGLVLAGSYLAGGAARAALDHARAERLATAASQGFSEAALRTEAAAMAPGALAVARRHDPYTAAGSAERDLRASLLAARLERPASNPSAAVLIRASFPRPVAPAQPFHLAADDSALIGSRELDCLSDAVYYEARGESAAGQAAVAQVVLNRVRHAGFPKTVCGVVYQGAQSHACQFSFACDGSTRRAREPGAWRAARAVAARAMSGFVMPEVGDATHFHVARLGGIWGAGLVKVAQVGAHVFYRLTGRSGPPAVNHVLPELLGAPSELAEKPVYASPAKNTADGAGSELILASAVTTPKLAEGGPAGPAPEQASAPIKAAQAEQAVEKPAPAIQTAVKAAS